MQIGRQAGPFLGWLERELRDSSGADGCQFGKPAASRRRGQVRLNRCLSRASRIGKRIATLRLEKGLNREQLAGLTRIPYGSLTELETGLQDPIDESVLRRVAAALEVTPEDLSDRGG